MLPVDAKVMKGIAGFLLWAYFLWLTFKDGRGNRVIECGTITLSVFLLLITLINVRHVPENLLIGLGITLLALCWLTLFFLVQQGYRALRARLQKRSHNTANGHAPLG